MVYVLFALGLVLLVAGAEALVRGASQLAAAAGLSPLVVGLTVVAFGTSTPELAVTVLSALEGAAGADVALGNVVGSNIFNILAVLGLGAAAGPDGIAVSASALAFDVPVMIGAAVLCLPVFFTGYRIGRVEALLFLGYYAAYVGYTVLAAGGGGAHGTFGAAVLYGAVPATALGLLVAVGRQAIRRQ